MTGPFRTPAAAQEHPDPGHSLAIGADDGLLAGAVEEDGPGDAVGERPLRP
jgi:hypothetical protein